MDAVRLGAVCERRQALLGELTERLYRCEAVGCIDEEFGGLV